MLVARRLLMIHGDTERPWQRGGPLELLRRRINLGLINSNCRDYEDLRMLMPRQTPKLEHVRSPSGGLARCFLPPAIST